MVLHIQLYKNDSKDVSKNLKWGFDKTNPNFIKSIDINKCDMKWLG